jgi:hypothetical protein
MEMDRELRGIVLHLEGYHHYDVLSAVIIEEGIEIEVPTASRGLLWLEKPDKCFCSFSSHDH